MAKDSFPHIFIDSPTSQLSYTSPKAGRGSENIPKRNNRTAHGDSLKKQFEKLWKDAEKENEKLEAQGFSSKKGIYLEFKGAAGRDLITKSLEDLKRGIRLLNIREVKEGDQDNITIATIYIPFNKLQSFLDKINAYLGKGQDENGKVKHQRLISSIESIHKALLESFWQDNKNLIPKNNQKEKCEVWLRINNIENSKEDNFNSGEIFFSICDKLDISYKKEQRIFFPERLVVLIVASKNDLTELIKKSDQIAEFRRVKETARFWLEQTNIEQIEWVKNLKKRINVDKEIQISISILDTGINNGHELIAPVLSDNDCHTVNHNWGVNDEDGHGTLMAGLTIYGDLQRALEQQGTVNIRHKIESIKLIPKPGEETSKELYGHLTKQGVSKVEIENPNNKRSFCMAITSKDDRNKGRPSSWSGALDQIISGSEDDKKRLFIVAAGNINDNDEFINYPDSNVTNTVHDPAQSWNALTVGAYTDKDAIIDSKLSGYVSLAKKGELSPFSTTSNSWETKRWPIKPDFVLEGGNIAKDDTNFVTTSEDLSLLSLSHKPQTNQFEMIHATSAATAQASWMASQIQVQYPEIWPETIRALMIHSADWKDSMKKQFIKEDFTDKKNYQKMLRIFGYGVPSLDKAISSYKNSLTLISEQEIQPFTMEENTNRPSTKDMHFYEMPWPKEALNSLLNTKVKLKFTLSYFIEPGPGEIGWKDRYRYPSHGLRFFLCKPQENENEFKKRINKAARDENVNVNSSSDDRWAFGPNNRDLGSIHCDTWEGTAQDISSSNLMAVVPTTGWWKERHYLKKYNKKTRYSLIVSIETPEESIDIYTPVATQIDISIKTSI